MGTPRKLTPGIEKLIVASEHLSQAETLKEIVEVVRRAAREICGADGATFILRDGDLCHYVDEDAIAPLWKGQKFPLGACISGWSILNGEWTAIRDIYLDKRIPHEAYRPTFVKSLVMVPIREKNSLGAIGNYWAKEYQASAEDVLLLRLLAAQTGIALANLE